MVPTKVGNWSRHYRKTPRQPGTTDHTNCAGKGFLGQPMQHYCKRLSGRLLLEKQSVQLERSGHLQADAACRPVFGSMDAMADGGQKMPGSGQLQTCKTKHQKRLDVKLPNHQALVLT